MEQLSTGVGIVMGLIGVIGLAVSIIVVLASGRTRAEQISGMKTQLITLEAGNRELRAQNAAQATQQATSEAKIAVLERDVERTTAQLTQRAAVGELALNIGDMRLEFMRRLQAADKADERRETESIERHNGLMAALDTLVGKIDGMHPAP